MTSPISAYTCPITRQQCVAPMTVCRSFPASHRNGADHGSLFLPFRNVSVNRRRGLCRNVKVGIGGRKVMSMVGGAQLEEKSKHSAPRENDVQTVVVVGAGLAGLATALALHRVGVKALVLEQSGNLRAEGTSLTLFPNAWRALDTLGIADELRGSFTNITGGRMRSNDGKVIKEFENSDCPGGPYEVRAVERQALLKALNQALPSDTIMFNSRVKSIRKPRDMQSPTEVELENGNVIKTKVLVGCDGARSVVAQWMGLSEPRAVGQTAIRGLAEFNSGHQFQSRVEQIIGQGVRAGLVPVTQYKVYWFILFNTTASVPSRITDPNKIKEEALRYMEGWPSDILECIYNTPPESFNRSNLRDRWSIPLVTAQEASNGITLAGDAAHPMTPNLGQGGCTSLEDSVVLTRKLCDALRGGKDEDPSVLSRKIATALRDYENERWARTFRLTVKSFVFGSALAWDSSVICFVRDNFALPIIFRASVVLGSSKFDCGALPPPLD